jgi:hypothetical protein
VLCATAGQEDPFEIDSSLLLSSGRHGEDRKRQYFCTTMKHPYLAIWLTYCAVALPLLLCFKIHYKTFFPIVNVLVLNFRNFYLSFRGVLKKKDNIKKILYIITKNIIICIVNKILITLG